MTPGVGLVGSGNMGRAVAKMLVEASPATTIRAIYDPDPYAIVESRKIFGDEFVEKDSLESLLECEDVEWVMIASWNKFHAEQTIAAFAAGKHVFCQKPLAMTLDECLGMRDAAQRSGRHFVIGFNLRYSPHYRNIKERLDSGEIGEIVSFEFNETLDFNHGGFIMGDWRRYTENAGSHLLEKCCHDIDLANWMVGSRARRVASFGGNNFFLPENQEALARVGKTRSGRQGYMTWRDGRSVDPFTSDKDILDNQVVIIEYENQVRATLHLNSNTALPERRMYICGTRGTLRADLVKGVVEVKKIGFGIRTDQYETTLEGIHGGGDAVLALELAGLMNEGKPASTTLNDGLVAAVTCFAIDEAQINGTVVDCQPYWLRVDQSEPSDVRR